MNLKLFSMLRTDSTMISHYIYVNIPKSFKKQNKILLIQSFSDKLLLDFLVKSQNIVVNPRLATGLFSLWKGHFHAAPLEALVVLMSLKLKRHMSQ